MILINGEKFVDFGWISEVIPVFPPRIISSKGSVRKAPISFVFVLFYCRLSTRVRNVAYHIHHRSSHKQLQTRVHNIIAEIRITITNQLTV